MKDPSIKESRVILRRVQEHLHLAHMSMGASRKSVGFVDVVHHPDSTLGCLNYVTPRKNTAWVSTSHIESGLNVLNELDRPLRVTFAEGLYPPIFVRSLRELGLEVELDTPIMIYKKEGNTFNPSTMPRRDVTVRRVTDQQGMAIWWYVWQNAFYEVLTSGVEPLLLGRDMVGIHTGNRIDLLLYRYSFPVGVARVTLHNNSAHILALAILHEVSNPQLMRLLQTVALDAALNEGCDIVFATGKTETERRVYREMGFVDSGSIVCYAEPATVTHEEPYDPLAQPVLII